STSSQNQCSTDPGLIAAGTLASTTFPDAGPDRDQHLEAFRAARVRRQDRGAEDNALLARADPVTNARSAHRDRADAGHNLALGQVTVAHQPLTSIVGELVGVALEKPGHLRGHSLGQ